MYEGKRCILVVDDEARIRRALKDFLSAAGFFVLEAGDGEEGLAQFYAHNTEIDLILLDVMMPKRDGLSVLRELREASLVPVILLTARGEEYDQIAGFTQGADDYIAKPFSPSLLLLRVEALLKRLGKDGAQGIVLGPLQIQPLQHTASLRGKALTLTRREFDLLTYFVMNRGITITRDQLLNNVWGYDFEGEARTVDTHVKQLRTKLGRYSFWIKTVYRIGYRFEGPAS